MTKHKECHEEVTRQGEFDACGKVAVAYRIDPVEGRPYPVCSRHCRGQMVPLAAILATLPTPPVAGESDARWDTAIDILLNGRWVDPEAKIAVFAYHDGEISKAELKRRLL